MFEQFGDNEWTRIQWARKHAEQWILLMGNEGHPDYTLYRPDHEWVQYYRTDPRRLARAFRTLAELREFKAELALVPDKILERLIEAAHNGSGYMHAETRLLTDDGESPFPQPKDLHLEPGEVSHQANGWSGGWIERQIWTVRLF